MSVTDIEVVNVETNMVWSVFKWSETSDAGAACRQYAEMRKGAEGREIYKELQHGHSVNAGDLYQGMKNK